MQPQNTITDYLATIQSDNPGITCPACGSILGIRRQGSTDMILTENARLELDGYLASYRRFLEKLEQLLEQQNVYYKAHNGNYPFQREMQHYRRTESVEFNRGGVYKNIIADEVVDQLIQKLDFFEWIENFYDFPRQINQDEATATATLQKVKTTLLGGLEPRSIAGPIMDLIFDQQFVADWQNQILRDRPFNSLDDILQEICPAIQWYLEIVRDNNQNATGSKLPFGAKSQTDKDLLDGILRVQFILAIVLGHRTKEQELLLQDLIKPGTPFTLPRKTIVSPKYLQELLCSEIVLGNPRIGLDTQLLQQLKQDLQTPMQTSNGEKSAMDTILNTLRNELHKFVHFTCTGSASQSIADNPQTNADPENQKHLADDTCGWYPKTEPTHSVILLGSPGTSKSSVMLTGFTTFYDNVFALGATISFDSPEDKARMKQLNDDYRAGQMPKPTKKGDRTTIKLSVEFPGQGHPRTNFVFTDIAGEVMARSLTHEGSDPAVLRILKNAETIVFFFDLSIEPSIRQKLTEGDDETWGSVEKNFLRVYDSRKINPDDQATRPASSAAVSQLQLLQRLIRDLRLQESSEAQQQIDRNFICVIPKMDLFANDGNNDRYFFSGFIKDLKTQSLLVRSNRNRGDETLNGLRSLGGIAVDIDPNGSKTSNGKVANRVGAQKQIGRWISDQTLNYLGKIGNALNEETAAPIKESLKMTLQVGLVATLHNVFGEEQVYFFPVSAQGQDSEHLNLGNPPNQKLSEYVFILPVALSVNDTPIIAAKANSDSSTGIRKIQWR